MYESSLILSKSAATHPCLAAHRPKPIAIAMTERFVHRHLPYVLARASHALWRDFEPRLREAGLNSLE